MNMLSPAPPVAARAAHTGYRPDIDGLRALAVVPVLLYHAHLFGMRGGFVGVDIFFVISGFLITGILRSDVATGRFSLTRFYDRRIRRILPAYFVVALATTFAATFILPPQELTNYGRRLASSAAFVSNFFFARTGYFAPSSADNPLLHTWSLSVEEQFYVVWPLLMATLCLPRFARWRGTAILGAFALSLAAASYEAFAHPATAFYSSPLRAWELLLGAIIAFGFMPDASRRTNEWLGVIGIAAIAASILLYSDGGTVFPGIAALLPCLGTGLIIAAGQNGATTAGRLLSARPLVFIGRISYSLYLWHWPIICLARIYLGHELQPLEAAAALLASFCLATLSWHFVENPVRAWRPPKRRAMPLSLPLGGAILASLLVTGVVIDKARGWPQRMPEDARIAASEKVPAKGASGCLTGANDRRGPREDCLFGAASTPRAVLLGDSHASAFAPALDAIARQRGFAVRQWTKASCAPLLSRELWPTKESTICRDYLKAALNRIAATPELDTIIIAGFWSNMQDDGRANLAREPAGAEAQTRLRRGLETLVAFLSSQGKTVILLGQTPVFPNGGGDCVIRQRYLAHDAARTCRVPQRYEAELLSPADEIMAGLQRRIPKVHVYRGANAFCADGWCMPLTNGHVAVSDEHHLTTHGATALVPGLTETFAQAGL
jgi:peptidoglycan/LPS O-acetylase OafA/YrhL